MATLFEATLQRRRRAAHAPMRWSPALEGKDVLVSSITDRHRCRPDRAAAQERQADRPVRQWLRQYRHRRRLRGGADGHQHAQRADRGHRRHGGDADAGAAAAAGRGRRGAAARRHLAGLVADLDAGAAAARQGAGHRRHGPDRHRGGERGPAAFGLNIHYFSRNRRPPALEKPLEAHLLARRSTTMVAEVDIVSLHTPHTRDTYHILESPSGSGGCGRTPSWSMSRGRS